MAVEIGLIIIGMGLAALGGGIGIGILVGLSAQAIVRQPEMSGAVRTLMFIGVGVIEGVVLAVIVVGLINVF